MATRPAVARIVVGVDLTAIGGVAVAIRRAGDAAAPTRAVRAYGEARLIHRCVTCNPARATIDEVRAQIGALARAQIAEAAPRAVRLTSRAEAHRIAEFARKAVLVGTARIATSPTILTIEETVLAAIVAESIAITEVSVALENPALRVVTAEIHVRRNIDSAAAHRVTCVAAGSAVSVVGRRVEAGREVEWATDFPWPTAALPDAESGAVDTTIVARTRVIARRAVVVRRCIRLTSVVEDAVAVERRREGCDASHLAATIDAFVRLARRVLRTNDPAGTTVVDVDLEIHVAGKARAGARRVAWWAFARWAIIRQASLHVGVAGIGRRERRRRDRRISAQVGFVDGACRDDEKARCKDDLHRSGDSPP